MRALVGAAVLVASMGGARAEVYRGDGFTLVLPGGQQRETIGSTVRTFETLDGGEALGVTAATTAKPLEAFIDELGERWATALGPLRSCGTVRRGRRTIACLESGLALAHQTARLGVVSERDGRVVLIVYRDRRQPASVRSSAESFLRIMSSVKPAAARERGGELVPPTATASAREELGRLARAKGAVSIRLLLYPRTGGHEVPGHPGAVRLDVQPYALEELPADVHLRIGGAMASLRMLDLLALGGGTIDFTVESGLFAQPARR